MKARPFLAVVLAVAVSLLTLAGVGWWWVLSRSPLQLQHQSLALPLGARFVPRQAPLSLYWLADGQDLEAYARAVAPGRQRRQAVAAVNRLRDGAFAAAGLDYANELAAWLGPETGLTLLAERPGGPVNGWLLSLRSRDSDGARRFLQRFWQTRSLAGADLQIGSYRGMGLISGRGAVVGQDQQPLATALINDDLVLIASGRAVLEQALDVSQIAELNQAASPDFQAAVQQLGEGLMVLQARPEALQPWLALPAGSGILTAALRPEGAGLAVEARLAWPEALPAVAPTNAATGLLQAYRGDPGSLALLQVPSRWPPLLQQLLHQALAAADAGPVPALVAAADPGPLLWARGEQGWQLGTPVRSPDPKDLEAALQEQGLVAAPVDLQGQSVRVWTRLVAGPKPAAAGSLEATVVAAHGNGPGAPALAPTWWAQSLPALGQLLAPQPASRLPVDRLRDQLEELGAPRALLRWALAPGPGRALLQQWQPWQLLSGLAAQPLAEAVQGLSLSLEPQDSQLLLRAHLRLA
ncbi:MAG: DUF3352 domain-containing protein [Cyanobacteriota bacterium]|nr:DUF3352 domain-containing protein [Cyanobacteriota bacterium]